MAKKLLMGLAAVLVVAGGVAALSAYEAHVINVTAHIENALFVHQSELEFGTVFPQEYIVKPFQIELSDSFEAQKRVDTVNYEINQKPKCKCDLWDPKNPELCPQGEYLPVNYTDEKCPTGYTAMLSLCPFLSKLPIDEDGNDTGVPSYYVEDKPDYCVPRTGTEKATGRLNLFGDYIDTWNVDLKVPPVAGTVGQDWPASCPTVPTNSVDYGCDLWIEATSIYQD